jgi:hypothetical protein
MLNIGRKQKLVVVKKVEFGIYLGETREAGEKERVLLPIKQVPEGTKEGDELEVFLYRDSSDRLIATTREPKLVLGELAVLNVAATGKIGAFLDWGLEKDLFLPFKQQTRRLHPGDEVLVSLYIDKSDRLCATMKVYHFLKTNSPYVVGDTEVKEDGKLSLSARGKAYEQIAIDAESVLSVIEEFAGVLPFDDKASPEVIQREFGLSKAAFKRAVGHLMKEKQVVIRDGKIWTAEKAK